MEPKQLAIKEFRERVIAIKPERSKRARREQYHEAKDRLLPLLASEDRTAGNRFLAAWFKL